MDLVFSGFTLIGYLFLWDFGELALVTAIDSMLAASSPASDSSSLLLLKNLLVAVHDSLDLSFGLD